MKTCIICRLPKESFNDEHVIPDSIQGYYHIYAVCTDCNSKLGSNIDSKLTNHKFIEFQRSLLNIKGKSGAVPEPFKGTHTLKDEPGQKVRLEVNNKGEYEPVFLPRVPDLSDQSMVDSFKVVIDKKDEKNLDGILSKLYKRNGIDPARIKSEKTYHESRPWVEVNLTVDIHQFKAAMLKIAYEFAVDMVPDYFEDDQAKVISSILLNADFENLTKKVQFFGSGFDRKILEPFSHMIDFENKNHYLILLSTDMGLACFINLFDTFSIGIKLSDKEDFLTEGQMFVGKNDLDAHSFTVYTTADIMNEVYDAPTYQFEHFFPEQSAFFAFLAMKELPGYDFYYEDKQVPLFNDRGMKIYDSVGEKIRLLPYIPIGDEHASLDSQYVFDERIFIKMLPSMRLYEVTSVIERRQRNSRI